MSYAIEANARVVRTADEFLVQAAKPGTVYLATDLVDLTAADRVSIRCSLVSLTRTTILLPTDNIVIGPPFSATFRTTIYPFDGMTWVGIDLRRNPALGPLTLSYPVLSTSAGEGPEKQMTFRNCTLSYVILTNIDNSNPADPRLIQADVNCNITDCTILDGLATVADLCKIRRTQYTYSAASSIPNVLPAYATDSPLNCYITANPPELDRSLYASSLTMQTLDIPIGFGSVVETGISVVPFDPDVPSSANRAEIFDMTTLGNSADTCTFQTMEQVFIINSTFTAQDTPPANPLVRTYGDATIETFVEMDTYGLATNFHGASVWLNTTAPGGSGFFDGVISIGENEYVAAEYAGQNISVYILF